MSQPTSPIRSEEYWFDDGDIVLSVTEDRVEHHFRVHRALLAIASPVFRDMFSMSQKPNRDSPLVPFPNDSVHDMNALMGALYSMRSVKNELSFESQIISHHACRKPQTVTHDIALGIIRLSHKYQINGYFQGMMRKLQVDWPPKYTDYLSRREYLEISGWRVLQAAKLIEITQGYEINDFLPTAFYELASAWGTQGEEIAKVLSTENVVRLCVGCARVERRSRALESIGFSTVMWGISPRRLFEHRRKFQKCSRIGEGVNTLRPFCHGVVPAFRNALIQHSSDGFFRLAFLKKCQNIKYSDEKICSPCQK